MLESLKLSSIKVVYHYDPTLYGKGVASELALSFDTKQDAQQFFAKINTIQADAKQALIDAAVEQALTAAQQLTPAEMEQAAQADAKPAVIDTNVSKPTPQQIAERTALIKYFPPAITDTTITLKLKGIEVDKGVRVNALLTVLNTYDTGIPELITIDYPSTNQPEEPEKPKESKTKPTDKEPETKITTVKAPEIRRTTTILSQSHDLTGLSLVQFEENELLNQVKPSLTAIIGTQYTPELLNVAGSTVLSLRFANVASLKVGTMNFCNWAVDNSVDLTYQTIQKSRIVGGHFELQIKNSVICDLFETIINKPILLTSAASS